MNKSGKQVVGATALMFASMIAMSLPQVASAAVASQAAESFKTMDANGDGFASVDEAYAVHISADAFVAADSNKDGKLDADEYAASGLTPVVEGKGGKAAN